MVSREVHLPSDLHERHVLYAALDSFRQYRRAAHYNITHLRRLSFYSLPSAHVDILCEPPFSLPATFDAVDKAIDSNADIAEAILAAGLSMFNVPASDESWKGQATPVDVDKARSTIRQLYRDWSTEGVPERHASYSPIMTAVEAHLPSCPPLQRRQQRILVPGAGLGRLAFDLCLAGYSVEGNEISYHQLIASSWMLNHAQSAGQHKLYPWALSFNNHLNRANQLQFVGIPDVYPDAALEAARRQRSSDVNGISMTAGDFCEMYQKPGYSGSFDAVTTCFFIDTAPNVIRYMETVHHCLKPGSVWINLGPLLWHFEAAPTPAERHKDGNTNGLHVTSLLKTEHPGLCEPGSFELGSEEVIALVERCGFDMVEHESSPATGYIQDAASMLQNVYRPVLWVAKKR